jgi:hypothetical protein
VESERTVFDRAERYLPPWRERLANGQLGPEYGPTSPGAFGNQTARSKDWSWRQEHRKPMSRESRVDAEALRSYMRLPDGSLRLDVPERERQVYVDVYEAGHSPRWVARERGINRDTVKGYLKRLRSRLR